MRADPCYTAKLSSLFSTNDQFFSSLSGKGSFGKKGRKARVMWRGSEGKNERAETEQQQKGKRCGRQKNK